MGTKGRAIVGTNADRLVELLNEAFADERLSYYRYWLGAKTVAGPMKDAVIAELIQHAADELRHADLISNRIIQLGGTPVRSPKQWFHTMNCDYDGPMDPYVGKILEQGHRGRSRRAPRIRRCRNRASPYRPRC
jgi:bacterioferritin